MIRFLLWSMVLGTVMVALVAALANAQMTSQGGGIIGRTTVPSQTSGSGETLIGTGHYVPLPNPERFQIKVPKLGCPKGTEPTLTAMSNPTSESLEQEKSGALVYIKHPVHTTSAYWDCEPPQSGEK